MVGFVPDVWRISLCGPIRSNGFLIVQRRRRWFIEHRRDLFESVAPMVVPGSNNNLILGLLRPDQVVAHVGYMLDENEFLSHYGVRAVSRYHRDHPLVFPPGRPRVTVGLLAGRIRTNLFGGNSNWRGPIWMPVNFLIRRALKQYHLYYGDKFHVECPTGSGNMINLDQVAEELGAAADRIFLLDAEGRREQCAATPKLLNNDPNWRDLIPFHEYFHGDTGRACGASHQTGWTGLIA